MRRIRSRLITLARGRLPVILGGATGTGKSLIARHFIHARSGRKGRFVGVDLSTIPKDLVAAQLFGSLRGAYTGAVADRAGAFEEADGGTLFLDEIGNLGEDVQKMLLTVLQEGTVTRIGDNRERKVSVKLVVASNEDLGEMVSQGRFRADLYMRLNPAATVSLPSLRERKVDMARLLAFAVERVTREEHISELVQEYRQRVGIQDRAESVSVVVSCGSKVKDETMGQLVLLFPERTMRILRGHSWPGNLREFAMTVENAMMLSLAEAISAGRPPGVGPAAQRADVIQIRPKMVRDLILAVRLENQDADETGWKTELRVHAHPGLNKVAQDVERQYFVQLYLRERGDFAGMAQTLLGDPEGARKVQLRFNQLGLKVRELKARLP
jgi:DNA-binding NtrC family response regulator